MPPTSPAPQGSNSGGNEGSGSGCGCRTILMVLLVLLLVGALFNVFSIALGPDDSGDSTPREALPASATVETAYYTDADGDWVHSPSAIESGLRHFYQETGVQPYVYILPNGSETSTSVLEQQAQDAYDSLFQDEGHFLLMFCDTGNGTFNCGYTCGSAAKGVMDASAISVLQKNLDRYYQTANTDEEVFSLAFSKTADEIMDSSSGDSSAGSLVASVIVVVAALAVLIVLLVLRRRDQQQKLEEKKQAEMERILSQPLETFGDKDVEDLADKYEGK